MTLSEAQRKFTRMIGSLIFMAYANGYELSFGDAYRDPRGHGKWGEKKVIAQRDPSISDAWLWILICLGMVNT